mmetsp:Transcript_1105/g.2773  ORF Transcript_1105/g.2773 Transcript_1105/m.2773 type:complete len:316 (+) Transcript_1105:1-948(+)
MISLKKVVEDELGAAMVRKRRVQELWAGYGEIVRVDLADDRSVVVKAIAPPPGDGSASHGRKLRSYAVEEAFYRSYARRLDGKCRVAELLAARHDDGDRFLFLEDLDVAGYSGRRSAYFKTIDEVQPLVKWLAMFHKTFMATPAPDLWPRGTYWHLATRAEELGRMKDSDPLRRFAGAIDDCLGRAKHRTLVHGDAKLANFCFAQDDVAAVDFQYVGGGVGVQDLAYLLGSCLTEKNLDAWSDDLLTFYFRHLDQGPDVEREWRSLWPFCFADFERFLAGWSPGHWKRNGYTKRMCDDAVHTLTFLTSRTKAPTS